MESHLAMAANCPLGIWELPSAMNIFCNTFGWIVIRAEIVGLIIWWLMGQGIDSSNAPTEATLDINIMMIKNTIGLLVVMFSIDTQSSNMTFESYRQSKTHIKNQAFILKH